MNPAIVDFDLERSRHQQFFGRDDIIAKIDALLHTPHLNNGWVLITGAPGIGKSAILSNYLERLEKSGPKIPHHFLRRNYINSHRPDVIINNLAARIEELYPDCAEPDVPADQRLVRILTKVSKTHVVPKQETLLLIIDGLDEADCIDGMENPLRSFLPYTLPPYIKVLCSSRAQYPHLNFFRNLDHVQHIDLDQESKSNMDACQAFWNFHQKELNPALTDKFVVEAVKRSEGNLLHAVKLWEYLLSHPDDKSIAENIPQGLKGVIEELWDSLEKLSKEVRNKVRQGLGILCVAYDALPLSALEIMGILDDDFTGDDFLRHARPFLLEYKNVYEGNDAYRPFHESFREFVVDKIGKKTVEAHHALISGKFCPWPGDLLSEFQKKYAVQYAVSHAVYGSLWETVKKLCYSVPFLEARCKQSGCYDLVNDLQLASEKIPDENDIQNIRDIQTAIRMESHWLKTVPEEISSILYNRLLSSGWPADKIKNTIIFNKSDFYVLQHPVMLSGMEFRTLTGHPGGVTSCALSRNGGVALSASWDNTLKVWEIDTGKERFTLSGHSSWVTGCALSGDGQLALSASEDQTLKLWDTQTGELLYTLIGHSDWIHDCDLSNDGRLALSASADKSLKLWDTSTGKELKTLIGHSGPIISCALCGDGLLALSASSDNTLKLWDTASGKVSRTLTGHSERINDCALSGDGRLALSASEDKTLKIWDAQTGKELHTLTGHSGTVLGCALSKDGGLALSASEDKTLKLWDTETGKELYTLTGHSCSVLGCALSGDRRFVLSFSLETTLKLWNAISFNKIDTFAKHKSFVTGCVLSRDDRLVLSASDDQTLKLWETITGNELRTLNDHSGCICNCALSRDGRLALSASEDNTLKLWDTKTGKYLYTLTGHSHSVNGCSLSGDGCLALSASEDNTLKLWDTKTGKELHTLTGHTHVVNNCALSDDGKLALSASSDKTLILWDMPTCKQLYTLNGHSSAVWDCILSEDRKLALSASKDNTLKLWDTTTGKELHTFTGHSSCVTGCALSGDGYLALSSSLDSTLKLWNTETGQCLQTLYGGSALYCITCNKDASLICAGDHLGNIWFLRKMELNKEEYEPKPRKKKNMKKEPLRVFISYSHKDEEYRRNFQTHLANLKRQEQITVWDDHEMLAGDEVDPEIENYLQQADIIILLISVDFMASYYCYKIEMEKAMQRHENGTARVIPIRLRYGDIEDAPFTKLNWIPKEKPVQGYEIKDQAWEEVVKEIRRAVKYLQEKYSH